IVGMSSARTEDRYDAHAGGEQEFAHRNPPCDFDAGDDSEWNEVDHPFHSYEEDLRQFPKSGADILVTKKSIPATSLSQVKTLKNRAARRRDCCRHLIVGCTGGIRARRLRSQPPSQCVWPMRIWRSKSKLVPENYGPSRYLRGRWSVAL